MGWAGVASGANLQALTTAAAAAESSRNSQKRRRGKSDMSCLMVMGWGQDVGAVASSECVLDAKVERVPNQ